MYAERLVGYYFFPSLTTSSNPIQSNPSKPSNSFKANPSSSSSPQATPNPLHYTTQTPPSHSKTQWLPHHSSPTSQSSVRRREAPILTSHSLSPSSPSTRS